MNVDNVGDVFPSENTLLSQQIKHIYVYHHFMCDSFEDGTVEIQFFWSEENLADPFTNNLINGPFE